MNYDPLIRLSCEISNCTVNVIQFKHKTQTYQNLKHKSKRDLSLYHTIQTFNNPKKESF